MGGVDTVRGIGYQQIQAVMAALDVLDSAELAAMRVEGSDDVVDIELFLDRGVVARGIQVKTRTAEYTWSKQALLTVLRRWAALPAAESATFEFLTDGRLGPTGEAVRDALDEAAAGDRTALAGLLGLPVNDPRTRRLAAARIRIDVGGVGAVLSRAERQLVGMLPTARTAADARERAAAAVNALFVMLLERSTDSDVERRVVTRFEIAELLGVPADQPVVFRWPGSLRGRALASAAVAQGTVQAVVAADRPAVLLQDGSEDLPPTSDVSSLLPVTGPVLLWGRTGTGKSTAAELLAAVAAEAGHVVLVARAEAYLPGRLEALVADALSSLVGLDLPASTGRQVLSDREVTVVIDGASEIPPELRGELRDELRSSLASDRGARFLLAGRDVAVLRQLLPATVTPSTFRMVELAQQARQDLALLALAPAGTEHTEGLHHQARTLVAQLDVALGDAAGNPLLFTMGLTLFTSGVSFTTPAGLYQAFVERLAERSGGIDVLAMSLALGDVFAGLLDEGRRYADPYDWTVRLRQSVAGLIEAGLGVNVGALDESARRMGLITPVSYTQTVVPMHDSFADYLAGASHARGRSPLPARLQPGDDQRLLFAAELGGVTGTMAALVTTDRPFLSVPLSAYDDRELDGDAPAQVQSLLARLLPAGQRSAVVMWRPGGRRVVAVLQADGDPRWVDAVTGDALLQHATGAVIDDRGPLIVAVRLWRNDLRRLLTVPRGLPAAPITSAAQAAERLADHAERTKAATDALVTAAAPAGRSAELAAQVGPTGLTATVAPAEASPLGTTWPVTYRHTDQVVVTFQDTEAVRAEPRLGGRTSADWLLAKTPAAAAADTVRSALRRLTNKNWL